MEDSFVNEVLDLHKRGDWKTITRKYHDYPEKNKLLWVYPSEENFEFIKCKLLELNCSKILSVGCGSGLLEWMIDRATGISVSGIEVDGTWWKCRYAPPTFIDLLITSPVLEKDTNTIEALKNCYNTALLFCYFNDGYAFSNYLEHFSGNVLIIIGPDKDGVHTNPKPFEDINDEWKLYAAQEVRDSKDFIAIYCKNKI
ncbi:uncharacterized protein LOC119839438 [Zerene cesonia]|uniref:uncharacterized protein LOC119839438 n=1 Tax=Zerene cesonia TaxID=33412 RepID=UPI0018E59C94|nr:uncharacterized protein LOC119839438 [Zerene cesonia]